MKTVGTNLSAAIGLIALLGACKDSQLPTEPGVRFRAEALESEGSEGLGVFHRYVAIGTSISMGVRSDGVFWRSQENSWPAQLARLAGRELSQPYISSTGCGAPLQAPLTSGLRISGEPAGGDPNTRACHELQPGITLPTGNVAVDGARTRDALFSTTATYGGLRGGQYARVLPPGETQVSAMLAQNPKVVSVELGGNEVLLARSGIFLPGVNIELVEVWKPLYRHVLDAVESTAKHAVLFGMVDDAMEFPSFRTGQELWNARQTFAPFNVAIAEDCGTINSTNVLFVAVRVPDAAARGAARARAGLPGPHVMNCFNAPSSSGVQDFVLTAGEVTALTATMAEMDAFIRSEAERRGFAFTRLGALYSDVNVKAPFNAIALMTSAQPYGPHIGLDGIHPSAEGARVLADAAATALNARYNLGIPLSTSNLVALASR
ncbi:MAG: hypothetical protein ABR499_14360 [Gemmatimonadaceae bacterium]